MRKTGRDNSLSDQRCEQQQEVARLDAVIKANLRELGYGG
jgi:hypothetical protein